MKRYIYAIFPGILLYFLFDFTHAGEINIMLRDFGRVSFLYIALALSITPLLKFGLNQKYLPYRRVFGVISFYLALIHAGVYFYYEYLYSKTFFVPEHFKELDIISGAIALVIILLLGITSNNYSVNLLKGFWKKLQTLTYPLFVIVAIHVAFASRFEGFYMTVISVLVLLRTLAYLKEGGGLPAGLKVRYLCVPCGYIYDEDLGDPDSGIAPGTRFEDIPDGWKCPVCGVSKSQFVQIGSDPRLTNQENFEFKVVDKKMLTKDVVEVSVFSNAAFFIKPGQFGKFNWKDFEGEFNRSYSVVSYIDGIVKFCIKISENGRGGKLLMNLHKGDTIKMGGFFGEFILQDTQNEKVFLATGTGLSPIINMLNFAKESKKTLYFGVRNIDDVFYEKELSAIPGLDLKIFCSDIKEDTKNYKKGRIDLGSMKYGPSTEFYICGNPAMSTSLITQFQEKGYTNIYFEKY